MRPFSGLKARFASSIFLLYLLIFSSATSAAEPNGCGSGWNTFLVPDRILLLNCEIKASCNKHDLCYAICDQSMEDKCEYRRCRRGGDLYETDVCKEDDKFIKLEKSAQARRSSCDAQFGDDIRSNNSNSWGCKAVGVLYRFAVKEWGDGSFAGFGTEAQPAAWKQPQSEYNKALIDFLSKASEDELKKFVKDSESTTPKVNLCGRLRYTREEGLSNLTVEDSNACRVSK